MKKVNTATVVAENGTILLTTDSRDGTQATRFVVKKIVAWERLWYDPNNLETEMFTIHLDGGESWVAVFGDTTKLNEIEAVLLAEIDKIKA